MDMTRRSATIEVTRKTMAHTFILLVVGAAGGFIGWRLRIAGGTIIGAMLAVIIFKLLAEKSAVFPEGFKFLTQVLIGVMVGSTFRPEVIQDLKTIGWPVMISTLSLMAAGLVMSVVLARLGFLDIPTAYIATSPGAMSTLIGLAIDKGADTTLVMAFHVFRLTFVNLTAPFVFVLLAWWLRR